MNNYKSLKIMILITFISVAIYTLNNNFYKNSISFNYEKNEEDENLNFKIYIFNQEKDDFDTIAISNKVYFDEGDYIKEIIKNMPFYKIGYDFLSIYNLKINDKETLIVKLSKNFEKLDKKNLEILIKSINKTIVSNFKVDEIKIEFDSN